MTEFTGGTTPTYFSPQNKLSDETFAKIGHMSWRELSHAYAQLEEELETHRERHRDAKSNFATIQRLRAELLAHKENEGKECPVCVLEAEVADWKQSFALYYDALMRGTKAWKEAHPEIDYLPDTAKMMTWIVDRLDKLEAEIEELIEGDRIFTDLFNGAQEELRRLHPIVAQLKAEVDAGKECISDITEVINSQRSEITQLEAELAKVKEEYEGVLQITIPHIRAENSILKLAATQNQQGLAEAVGRLTKENAELERKRLMWKHDSEHKDITIAELRNHIDALKEGR